MVGIGHNNNMLGVNLPRDLREDTDSVLGKGHDFAEWTVGGTRVNLPRDGGEEVDSVFGDGLDFAEWTMGGGTTNTYINCQYIGLYGTIGRMGDPNTRLNKYRSIVGTTIAEITH